MTKTAATAPTRPLTAATTDTLGALIQESPRRILARDCSAALFSGDVDRVPEGVLGRLHERLREGRVRVDREREVLRLGAHLDRERRLGDEIARALADDP